MNFRGSSTGNSKSGRNSAYVKLVDSPHYRKDAFCAGLELCGYQIVTRPDPQGVLVLWNRYPRDENIARSYDGAGGKVLIAENAWLGPEDKDAHLFALCRGHHNGAGWWHVGAADRWQSLGIPLIPWRASGSDIVVLPQRGMGEIGVRMERDWTAAAVARLARLTARPIRVHHHPGIRPHPPIDWTDVWAAVTWGSGAAIKAIVAGIPVFYEFFDWIGGLAAIYGIDNLEEPFLGNRGPMLRDLSWAQWSAEEIAAGLPFPCLLK